MAKVAIRSGAAALAVAASLAPAALAEPVQLRWMGSVSCGDWPRNLPITNPQKAALLNWVLGYLSRASLEGPNLLDTAAGTAVGAWLDNYCQANPLDDIVVGADRLERELRARHGLPANPYASK